MILLGTMAVALAASPTPDRPTVSRGGYLNAADTLELEAGPSWQGGSSAVPASLEYTVGGAIQPQLGADLAGFDQGVPSLEAGLKIRVLESEEIGLAAFVASALPTSDQDPWYGTLAGLITAPLPAEAALTINVGADFSGEPSGGIAFVGVPVSSAVSTRLWGPVDGFAEIAALLGDDACDGDCSIGHWIFDGGVAIGLTEILVVDGALGWDLYAGEPFLSVGLSANFGTLGG